MQLTPWFQMTNPPVRHGFYEIAGTVDPKSPDWADVVSYGLAERDDPTVRVIYGFAHFSKYVQLPGGEWSILQLDGTMHQLRFSNLSTGWWRGVLK